MNNPYAAAQAVNPEDACTLDSLISSLPDLRRDSAPHGDTVVVVCLEDSGLEYQPIKRIDLDHDDDGAVCRIVIDNVPELKISAHGKPEDTLPVTVRQSDTGEGFGVEIEIPGYGRPVYLERDRETGQPVLYVSADPHSDDVSHKIPLPAFDISLP